MDQLNTEELSTFFLIFSAKHGLNEPTMEKIERILHQLEFKTMEEIKKACNLLVEKGMVNKPAEEILEFLKDSGFVEKEA